MKNTKWRLQQQHDPSPNQVILCRKPEPVFFLPEHNMFAKLTLTFAFKPCQSSVLAYKMFRNSSFHTYSFSVTTVPAYLTDCYVWYFHLASHYNIETWTGLNDYQVALMLSGMGSAGADVFRMVSMLLILFLLHFQLPDWFDCQMLP